MLELYALPSLFVSVQERRRLRSSYGSETCPEAEEECKILIDEFVAAQELDAGGPTTVIGAVGGNRVPLDFTGVLVSANFPPTTASNSNSNPNSPHGTPK